MLAAHADRLGHLALLGLEPAGRQEIGHTDDRVHRRPDFVTHIGQEVRLRLRRSFGGNLGALELSLRTLALDELADLPADTFKQSKHRGIWLAYLRAEELHHAQKPAGTDDRKPKRAVQAVLRGRRRPWEVRVVDNVGNPRGSPGAPNPTRKPNTVRECGAVIDLNHFLQQPGRGYVHLRAAEYFHLGIHAPVHSHDPV